MAGSGRPESKQVKIVGSAASKMNVPYFNQQTAEPPAGSTVQHPNAVQSVQQQQLQDKGGQ
jgi:hypothetical protein